MTSALRLMSTVVLMLLWNLPSIFRIIAPASALLPSLHPSFGLPMLSEILERENVDITWLLLGIGRVGNESSLLATVAMTSLLLHRHLSVLRWVNNVTSRTLETARLTWLFKLLQIRNLW